MIQTKRLQLEPLQTKYADDLFELWGDSDVVIYTNTALCLTKEECHHRVEVWVDQYTDPVIPNNLVVVLNEKAIGLIGFPMLNKEDASFGFFYQFNKAYWRQGYASESAQAALAYMVAQYPTAKFSANSVAKNLASIRLLSKLGFTQTKTDANAFHGVDVVYFELNA